VRERERRWSKNRKGERERGDGVRTEKEREIEEEECKNIKGESSNDFDDDFWPLEVLIC